MSSVFIPTSIMTLKYLETRQIPERPELVTFGAPYKDVLPKQLERLNVSRVYVVISKSLAETSSEVETISNLPGVKERLVGVKIGVRPHGDIDDVVEIIHSLHKLSADCLVTIGAGSISDACKNVKLGHSNNIKNRDDMLAIRAKIDFASGSIGLPDQPLNPPTLKLIVILTSLSGGEYNSKNGAMDRVSGKKYPFSHPDSMPDVIINDPYLNTRTPEWVWLSTGVRSVDHAIETLANPNINLNDPLLKAAFAASEEAIVLLMKGLLLCKQDPTNVEARDLCQRGVWKAGLAIVRGVPMGGSHAIGHILGYVGGVSHGHTSCVMCAAVNRYNYKVNGKQQDHIRDILVREGIVGQLGLQNEKDLQLWQILAKFIKTIGMPQSLAEVGIGKDKMDKIARETLTDFWSRTNPIPLDKPEQVMEILELAA